VDEPLKDFDPSNNTPIYALEFLRDLYTMMSRGRSGAIFIDPANKLSSLLGPPVIETMTTDTVKISTLTEPFKKTTIDYIDAFLSSINSS
jgi:hypothetical protein